jgi:hypothetical protein
MQPSLMTQDEVGSPLHVEAADSFYRAQAMMTTIMALITRPDGFSPTIADIIELPCLAYSPSFAIRRKRHAIVAEDGRALLAKIASALGGSPAVGAP